MGAVFIQQTMRSAQQDEKLMILMKARDKDANDQKLKNLFSTIDPDGDGFVPVQAFVRLLEKDKVRLFLSALEINVKDVESLSHHLDDGEGMIQLEDFITGLLNIRGTAKAVDMVTLLNVVRRIETKMNHNHESIHRKQSVHALGSDMVASLSPQP